MSAVTFAVAILVLLLYIGIGFPALWAAVRLEREVERPLRKKRILDAERNLAQLESATPPNVERIEKARKRVVQMEQPSAYLLPDLINHSTAGALIALAVWPGFLIVFSVWLGGRELAHALTSYIRSGLPPPER